MNRRGFALLELTAALAVIAIALATSLVVLQVHARNIQSLFEEKVAAQLASGEMERLEARGFEGVEEGETALAPDADALAQLRDGRCALIVARDGALWHARVRVTWRPQGRAWRQAEVDTFFRRRP